MFDRGAKSVVFFALVLLCVLVCDATALAGKSRNNKKGNRGNNRNSSQQRAAIQSALQQTKAQVQAAAQAKIAAQQRGVAAQQRAADAERRISAAHYAAQTAGGDAAAALEQLQILEQQILGDQGPESEYVRLQSQLEQAKADHARIREEVVESQEYKTAYRTAMSSADKATLLGEMQKKFFNNNYDYKRASQQLETARRMFENKRLRLLKEDADWVAASEDARAARKEKALAQHHLKAGLLHRATSRTDARDAAKVHAHAHATVQRGSSSVKSLEQKSKSLANQSKNQSKNRGKSNSRNRR